MAKKRVEFEIDSHKMVSVMQTLGPVMPHLSGFRVDDVTGPSNTRKTTRFNQLGAKRRGLVEVIIEQFPAQQTFEISLDTLYKAVVDAGYARTSMSSTMSKLAKDGWKIQRTEDGYTVSRPLHPM